MTKKDYELIANSINLSRGKDNEFLFMVNKLAYDLEQENSKFDSYRFYEACGLIDEWVKQNVPF